MVLILFTLQTNKIFPACFLPRTLFLLHTMEKGEFYYYPDAVLAVGKCSAAKKLNTQNLYYIDIAVLHYYYGR